MVFAVQAKMPANLLATQLRVMGKPQGSDNHPGSFAAQPMSYNAHEAVVCRRDAQDHVLCAGCSGAGMVAYMRPGTRLDNKVRCHGVPVP